jgi:hypothetical protein
MRNFPQVESEGNKGGVSTPPQNSLNGGQDGERERGLSAASADVSSTGG